MTASQIRTEARQKLASKWIKSAGMTFIFLLITYLISHFFDLDSMLGYLIFIIIVLPLAYGFVISMLNLNDDISITCLDFIKNGFTNFGKVWSIALYTALKFVIPILFIIACDFIYSYGYVKEINFLRILGLVLYWIDILYIFIKQFSYQFAIFILYDNSNINTKEAVEKSAELMQGNMKTFFCLILSFIGWAILSLFTLGIGLFWFIPYVQISEINFYRNLTGEISSEK